MVRAAGDAVFLSRYRKPLTRFGIYRLVQRCAACVPALDGRKITPHVLRHTTACHLVRAGVDLNTIRAWLGHVSLNTTNIYAEIDLEMKAKAVALCDTSQPGAQPAMEREQGPDCLPEIPMNAEYYVAPIRAPPASWQQ